MRADRAAPLLVLLASCLAPAPADAQDPAPSPELLELLGELDDKDSDMTALDILATDGDRLPAPETPDED